jgi:hypothetical protein
MTKLKYVDIVLVKSNVDSGRLKTKLDAFGTIYLEDTVAGESVKIGKLPEGYTFRPEPKVIKGRWQPVEVYPYSSLELCTRCEDGWMCSECGHIVSERQDWCSGCGTDMRESKKPNKEFQEFLDTL